MSRRRPDASWYALPRLRRILGRVVTFRRAAALRDAPVLLRPLSPARLLIVAPTEAIAWQDTEIDVRRVVL